MTATEPTWGMRMSDYSYGYSTDGQDLYCYDGTAILRNIFEIMVAQLLETVERDITGYNLMELERKPIKGNYDLDHLQAIHRAIFEDIYIWAGEIRAGDFLAKGESVFCKGQYIASCAQEIHRKLVADNFLRLLSKEQLIAKLAYYMGEINALHPFREGNGRTQREFFRSLAFDAGYILFLGDTDPQELLEADVSAFGGHYAPLEEILSRSLSTKETEDS